MIKIELIKGERRWWTVWDESLSHPPLLVNMAKGCSWDVWCYYRKAFHL